MILLKVLIVYLKSNFKKLFITTPQSLKRLQRQIRNANKFIVLAFVMIARVRDKSPVKTQF